MHILIVSRGMPTKKNPMYGIFEFDQAKALVKKGVNVTYFAVDLRSIRRKRKLGIECINKSGVNCFSISVPVGNVPRSILLKIGEKSLKSLYEKVFINNKPDIIHAHFTDQGYFAAKLAEKKKIPLIITEHSSVMNKPVIEKKVLTCAKYSYNMSDIVIAVGQQLSKNIYAKTNIKSIVIPNIMGEDDFFNVKNETQRKGFGFVSTGSLIDVKRPLLLIEAFCEVHSEYPNTYLGLIGDGNLKPKIEKRIKELGLSDCVKMLGRLSREQIAKCYSQFDCFVLPSARETFGVVFTEAMAAGLPVIATDCGGPEDFVTPEVGIRIPVDDKEKLKNAMIEMLINSKKYDNEIIRQYVKNHFSEDVVAEQLICIYKQILTKHEI